jgi:hypothetical protein
LVSSATRDISKTMKCILAKEHYPFILSNLFADLVKPIDVQAGGLATRSRAALGITP